MAQHVEYIMKAMKPGDSFERLELDLRFQGIDDIPQTCADIPERVSGPYQIQPSVGFQKPFEVFCDQDYEEGGWIVIQNRFNGSVDFHRDWAAYEEGFGNPRGEYWLGLKNIHELTHSRRHELLVMLEDFEGQSKVARYDDFRVADKAEKYTLQSLGKYSGTAGDSLSFAIDLKFSTKDADNDSWDGNCAERFVGAWWYSACHASNLNGKYFKQGVKTKASGMSWDSFYSSDYSLKRARMMIRPKV
ncbi:ficolin-2-like [Uranotaenia lowii]|uniref:ficolin-2-like n=1 Tax=Uranotaenia lowii TaxID=190385 RepID=UPI00247A4BE6|nr:ficolin-2-like [Uranotaenia lowii]